SMDVREVVVNIDGDFGTFSFGRTLSIFGRQAILKDQTLFGVGAPTGSSGGTTAGRIGRGYTYPNFNARFSYKTPNINGLQVEVGLYDPSREQTAIGNILDETDTPRFEGEISYTTTFDNGSFQIWMDGLWQDIESSALGASQDVTVSGFGAGGDLKMGPWNVLGSYYTGDGLGRSLQFVGGTRCDTTGNTCQEADNDGFMVQGSYTFNGKTKVAGSYGESTEDGYDANVGAGLDATRDVDLSMWTVGVYHDVNSWLKLIAEYSNVENEFGKLGAANSFNTEADVFSLGTFLFW
ncbi:MAG: porin, partial [Gammaproteobacteria bacterium]